ncbi:MAG: glycine--tRNA ligase [Anaerolineales bacterium]
MDSSPGSETIVALAKRPGFVFPTSEIYGGLVSSYDYGPLGTELLRIIRNLWWEEMISKRADMVGLDTQILLHPQTWVASGHVDAFTDPLVEDKVTHKRYRADLLIEGWLAENPQAKEIIVENLGRDQMAEMIVLDSTRLQLPFGIGQIGKSFRNEITLGQFVFRTLEFEQAEIEYFFDPEKTDWRDLFEEWRDIMWVFVVAKLGIREDNLRWRRHSDQERSHYSRETYDLDYRYPFGYKELWGLAYRTDFDLRQHSQYSGRSLEYTDAHTRRSFFPQVIEPAAGINRLFLMMLCDAYWQDKDNQRIVLRFKPWLAPYKVAVFPLLKNRPKLVDKARSIFTHLSQHISTTWDERSNIGKRYYYQDEIGTPFCVTVDFQILEDDTVTVRDRNTTRQMRVAAGELLPFFQERILHS